MGWIVLAVVVLVVLAVVGGVVWYWWTVISADWRLAKTQRDLARRIREGEVGPDDPRVRGSGGD